MFAQNDRPISSSTVRSILNGESIEVPCNSKESLAAIHAYLEISVLRKQRVLTACTVDGIAVEPADTGAKSCDSKSVQANPISISSKKI